MSRYASYLRALATGYGLLVINIAYSLAMVPLTLSHIGAESFGLWALTMQIGAIIQLADGGMTGALNRIFMDYKDDKSSAAYRQLFYTMWLTFSLLGAVVAILVYGLAPRIVDWLAIPSNLQPSYTNFLAAYGVVVGLGFCFKTFSLLPFVHQRSDLLNIVSAVGMVLGFVFLLIGLESGWGLWSLMASLAIMQIITTFSTVMICLRLHFLPYPSAQPRLSTMAFGEVYHYGKDRLLITAGFTALQAAPAFLITRLLGLEANAAWSVASRMNQVCLQLIAKVSDLSYPVLAEMYVRGEHEVMRRRYSHLLVIGLGIASLCAVGIATCNRDFVSLWTGGIILSTPLLDGMLALWLLTLVLQKFLFVPTSIARNLKDVRWFYPLESFVVVALGMLFVTPGGGIWLIAGILSVASLMVTIPRNFSKSARVLQCTQTILARPMRLLGLRVLVPACLIVALTLYMPMASQWGWLILKASLIASAMIALLSTLPALRQIVIEMLRRIFPRRAV
jgi:O-antigen/teichoic acid export membrane protein